MATIVLLVLALSFAAQLCEGSRHVDALVEAFHNNRPWSPVFDNGAAPPSDSYRRDEQPERTPKRVLIDAHFGADKYRLAPREPTNSFAWFDVVSVLDEDDVYRLEDAELEADHHSDFTPDNAFIEHRESSVELTSMPFRVTLPSLPFTGPPLDHYEAVLTTRASVLDLEQGAANDRSSFRMDCEGSAQMVIADAITYIYLFLF